MKFILIILVFLPLNVLADGDGREIYIFGSIPVEIRDQLSAPGYKVVQKNNISIKAPYVRFKTTRNRPLIIEGYNFPRKEWVEILTINSRPVSASKRFDMKITYDAAFGIFDCDRVDVEFDFQDSTPLAEVFLNGFHRGTINLGGEFRGWAKPQCRGETGNLLVTKRNCPSFSKKVRFINNPHKITGPVILQNCF